jgi:hypothetical protein
MIAAENLPLGKIGAIKYGYASISNEPSVSGVSKGNQGNQWELIDSPTRLPDPGQTINNKGNASSPPQNRNATINKAWGRRILMKEHGLVYEY